MSLELILIRHAQAGHPAGISSDDERPLTDLGIQTLKKQANWLKEQEQQLDLLLTSPLKRARQTSAIIAETLGLDQGKQLEVQNWIASSYDLNRMLETLKQNVVEKMAIVGHLPSIAYYTAGLLGGGHFRFSPGTMICMEFPELIAENQAQHKWTLTPEQFGGPDA